MTDHITDDHINDFVEWYGMTETQKMTAIAHFSAKNDTSSEEAESFFQFRKIPKYGVWLPINIDAYPTEVAHLANEVLERADIAQQSLPSKWLQGKDRVLDLNSVIRDVTRNILLEKIQEVSSLVESELSDFDADFAYSVVFGGDTDNMEFKKAKVKHFLKTKNLTMTDIIMEYPTEYDEEISAKTYRDNTP